MENVSTLHIHGSKFMEANKLTELVLDGACLICHAKYVSALNAYSRCVPHIMANLFGNAKLSNLYLLLHFMHIE
jgi:hypothetical protein